MLNQTVIAGRLVRDPELKYVPSGDPVCQFTVAVDRDYAKDGQRETDFFDCVAWRKTAETVANNLGKGRLVGVTGRMQSRSYDTQDGQKRRVWELQVERVHFLDRKPKDESESDGGAS
jgi:single-strand DNA-binding protein